MSIKRKQLLNWLLVLFIPVYGVFLSLPFVTEVGYEYLRNTAEKSKTEMNKLAVELSKFRAQYGRYPHSSASQWITDASLTVDGKDVYMIPYGAKGEGIFDPFIADAYTQPYRYYSDGETWFVVACDGPDQDEDVTPDVLRQFAKPSYEELQPWTYNPHQGYRSGGDVVVTNGEKEKQEEKIQ